jgi:hypothetical protein
MYNEIVNFHVDNFFVFVKVLKLAYDHYTVIKYRRMSK